MNSPGSLCPAIKAAEIIGDKWVLLILRELLQGTTRYNDFQRALPRISPTVLSKRLKQMEQHGLIVRKTAAGGRSKEYRLTASGREVGPIVHHMSNWGLRWARRQIEDEDLDVASFMWDFHRTLNVAELPDGDTVFNVRFEDLDSRSEWWLIASRAGVDLCTDDPGQEIDLYMSTALPAAASVWMGDLGVRQAVESGFIRLSGSRHLAKTAHRWFPRSRYSDVRPERFVSVNESAT
jgi:DNA-binding HxlR family transcriptional regulator